MPQTILPDKETFSRTEILEILSNYTLIPNRKNTHPLPDVKEVKQIVEQVLEIEDLSERSRKREISDARHIYCYICYSNRLGKLEWIGAAINRNYSTILHSFKTTRDFLQSKGYTEFKEKYTRVAEVIMAQYKNMRL